MKFGFLLLITLTNGCASYSPPTPPTWSEWVEGFRQALNSVTTEDGIDRSEADIIGASYFWRYGGTACGGVGEIVETPTTWLASVAVGYAAIRLEDIVIHKQTGMVSWANGPTVEDPRTIWDDL